MREDGRQNAHADTCKNEHRPSHRRQGTGEPDGSNSEQRDEHRRPKSINPRSAAVLSDTMAEHHVQHEESTVGKGEHEPKWLPTEPYIRQQPSTSRGQKQRDNVASSSRTERRQRNGTDELDRPNGSQGQAGNRKIQARIHPFQLNGARAESGTSHEG